MRLIAALLLLSVQGIPADTGYAAEILKWRADREARLRAPDGWLSLTGLFWLRDGENRVGSAKGSRVELPPGFPPNVGKFLLKGKQVMFQAAGGAAVQLNGKPVQSAPLRTDKGGAADVLGVGRLKLLVIERGDQIGVRMRDSESEYRRNFKGLRWFPVKPEWRIRARFVPQPRIVFFDAQAGGKQEMSSPGYVEWEQGGRKLRLTPVTEDEELFFVFRDRTAGKSTYGAARFVYAGMPSGGFVTLDFNKAYNPPCVFTPYATCPLPPPENRLPVPVEAGEMMYESAFH